MGVLHKMAFQPTSKTLKVKKMEVLYIVLPLALVFSAIAVGIFVWAARDGQFDDLDTPAMRILQEDRPPAKDASHHKTNPPPSSQTIDHTTTQKE
jgi:cbb3-type cytochrome oxidase maturation protein